MMIESCLGAFTAMAVIACGCLGDVIMEKNSLNLFSGSLIAIGNSMMTVQGVGISVMTSRIIHGFGFGIIFSTLPAYVSQPGFAFLNSVLRSSTCVLLGAIAARHISSTSLDEYLSTSPREVYLGLISIGVILLWMFRDRHISKIPEESGQQTSETLQPSMARLKQNSRRSLSAGRDMIEIEDGHPYDYYFRPGDILRPPPSRTLHSPEWFPMRKRLLSRYIDVQPIPKRTPLVEKMQDHFWQGDEYMDPVISLGKKTSMSKVRAMMLQALSSGIESVPDAPQEIVNLFQHLDRKPEWFDEETFERGRIILANSTPIGRLTALAMNIIITSQASSVANAVGSTGQYTNPKTVMRRHLETTHFFHRVSLPQGSHRFSETFQEIVKVRFMHSQVRFAARKRWGEKAFGEHGNPISNTDMALGITAFGIQNLISDSAFGRDFAKCDLDAAVRHWGYIAYVFGVSENLIPLNFQEGVEQFDYILSTHGKAPEWSPAVADSFLIVPEEAVNLVSNPILRGILTWTAVPFFHGLLYYFGGDDLSYRVLSTRYTSRVRMRIQAIFAVTLGTAFVTLSTVIGSLPGHEGRMIARASRGSPTGESALRLIGMMARKAGVREVTFETHDMTSANSFKPIRA